MTDQQTEQPADRLTDCNDELLTRPSFKGTGYFFETLSVASVPGTDHS